MSKYRGRSHRRPRRAVLRLEALEDRAVFNVTPAGAVDFGSLVVNPGASNPSQILVRFRPGATPDAGAVLNGTTLGPALRLVIDLWAVRLAPGVSVQAALAAYKSHPSVAYAQEDFRVRVAGPDDDPDYPRLWGLNNTGQTSGTPDADIDAPEAWAVTTGNSSTVVAVIDTGVDYNHPDLSANMWVNADEIPGNGIDDDGNGFRDDVHGYDFVNNDSNPMDDYGHGTHVAGTIAAVDNTIGVIGVAPGVKIMALKFLDAGGYGYTSDAIRALNYAVANGATISNNSWGGGGFDQALYDAIRNAGGAGHIFVAAAGNNGSNNDSFAFYPASYDLPNLISVAATDHNDALAGFSNYGGTSVDLGAPGVSIYSTTPGNTYASYNGTSMATPHVAGVVALIRGQHPDWGYAQVKDQLLSSVDPVPALAGRTVTGGRLNAYLAVSGIVDFGPRVVAHSPTGSINGSVSSVQFTFSEAVTGFTREDISSFTDPNSIDLRPMVTGVSGSGTTYTVSFSPQSALGGYRMVIGPEIYDSANQAMDQNRNGTPGEPEDTYAAAFAITSDLTFAATDLPKAIWSPSTTVSYLTVDQNVTIADLNLKLDITFPNVYDLDINLYSPQGTRVWLAYPYQWGPDFHGTVFDDEAQTSIDVGSPPFEGSYRPKSPLSAVDGQDAFGTWELRVVAWPYSGSYNDGWLNSWSITVQPQGSPNRPPVAGNDSYSTSEDTPLTVAAPGVLGNDSDPDGNPLTAVLVSDPGHGTLTLNGNGSFTYTPAANYNGTDSFTYRANDSTAVSNIATVSLTVTPVNDPPVASDDGAVTSAGVAVAIPVLANDSDPDGDALTVATFTQGSNGVVVQSGGSLIYTPNPGFTGTDTFSYTASDGNGGTDAATVTVTVRPENRPPMAADDSASTPEDVAVSIPVLANDSDPDGDPLTVVSFTQGGHGAVTSGAGGSLVYTPNANFNGADSFSYAISDGRGGTDTATVSVTVTPVNDPPVAADDSYSTNEDATLTIPAPGVLANDTDVDGNAITAVRVSGPSNGALSLNPNGSFTYTPNGNFNGSDSFTYRANDGTAYGNVATVRITVTPVNDAPVAQPQSVTTTRNTPKAITLVATDVDGDALTYTIVTPPANGTLSGTGANRTYTPFANYVGPDSFTFQANDGSLNSNVATVSITVAPVQTGNLIVNPGFETGNFSGWMVAPDPYGSYFGVGGRPRSGRYAAYFGSYWGRDDIYQNVPTIPGHTYRISYWVRNDGSAYGGGWTEIRSSWGGAVLEDLFPDRAFPYQQRTFTRVATSTSTEFRVGGYGYLYFWRLDDVSVTDVTPAGAAPASLGAGIANGTGVADAVLTAAISGTLTAGGKVAVPLSVHGLGSGFVSSGGLASAPAGQGDTTRGAQPGVNTTALDRVFATHDLKRAFSPPLGDHRPAWDLGDEFRLPGLPA